MSFCAICTDEAADLERSEDGFLECGKCRGEAPREAHGVERSYEPSGFGWHGMKKAIDKAYAKLGKKVTKRQWNAQVYWSSAVDDGGRKLYKVSCNNNGRRIDFDVALRIAEKAPWYRGSSYVGCDQRFYVWRAK